MSHVIIVSPQSQWILDRFGVRFGSKGTGLGTRA